MAFSAVTERGSGTIKTAGTTVTMNPSANLTVGKIVFAFMVGDNTATTSGATTTHTSMADTDGNTWNKVFERTMTAGGAASDGSTASLWWTKVATQIDTTDTITGTMASTVAKVLMVWEVTIGSGTIQVVASGETFLETSAPDPAALTLAGLASKEYLFLGTMGAEDEQLTWTEEATFTNVFASEGVSTGPLGTPASNQTGFAASRIATDTGASFDIAYATAEKEIALVAFEEVTSGVTGTVAVTLADFTSAASGTVANPVTGTVAVTLADATSAASGVETITGTAAVTLGDATSAASGTVANPVTGTVAVTLEGFTSAATGTVQQNVTGSVAATLEDFTSAASGTVTINITGSAAVTLDDFTSSASAVESMSGTVAVTLADFTSTASGVETITGSAAVTLADATSTASGTETITGSSAVTLADFTLAGVGNVTVSVTGTVAVVLEDFTSAAAGTVVNISTVVLPVEGVIGDADREATIGSGDRAGVLTSGNRTGTIR